MKKKAIVCTVVAASIAMALVDSVLQPGYLIKSVIKIVLFLFIPLLLSAKEKLSVLAAFHFRRQALLTGGILGIATYGVIIGAYAALQPYLDLSGVADSLERSAGVTKDNFLLVGTYIALCNSLLEEFFFRCFAFLTLAKTDKKIFAYLFSALCFAIYHAGMLITMVAPLLFALALIALFLCGLLLNCFNARSETIWTSWLLHMGANLAINTVGMILLRMV